MCNCTVMWSSKSHTHHYSEFIITFFIPQPKHLLIGEVVRVFGVERTLGLFQKTVTIQEAGGALTADEDKKSVPYCNVHVCLCIVQLSQHLPIIWTKCQAKHGIVRTFFTLVS